LRFTDGEKHQIKIHIFGHESGEIYIELENKSSAINMMRVLKYYLEYLQIIQSDIDTSQPMYSLIELYQAYVLLDDISTETEHVVEGMYMMVSWLDSDSQHRFQCSSEILKLLDYDAYRQEFIKTPGALKTIFSFLTNKLDQEFGKKVNPRHMQCGMTVYNLDIAACALSIILKLINFGLDDQVLEYMDNKTIDMIVEMTLIEDEYIPYLARDAIELLTHPKMIAHIKQMTLEIIYPYFSAYFEQVKLHDQALVCDTIGLLAHSGLITSLKWVDLHKRCELF
jgi:hypothetical protein